MKKRCSTCEEYKDPSLFGKHAKAKDGLYTLCNPCRVIRSRKYYRANKLKISERSKTKYVSKKHIYLERARRNRYAKLYGITVEQYDEMFKQQEGKCAVCRAPQELYKNRFCVDHSHVSGKTRGLLCIICNIKICGLIDRRAKSKNVKMSEFEFVTQLYEYYKKSA